MIISRANHSDRSDAIILRCLALPNRGSRAEVEIIDEEGTLRTDLSGSDVFNELLEHLHLHEDNEHTGCNEFYLTISYRTPDEMARN